MRSSRELELKSAHQELMTCYVRILNQVDHAKWRMIRGSDYLEEPTEYPHWFSKLPHWLRKPISKLFRPSVGRLDMSTALRFLVRLFVEGHIRKKLKELSEGYIILRANLPADAKDLRDWTKECSDVCDKMSVTLTTWTSLGGVARLLWPPALGGLTVLVGVRNPWEVFGKLNLSVYAIAYGLCFYPAVWLVFFLSTSYRYKHEMLIGITDSGQSLSPNSGGVEFNAYVLENRLFSLLGRRKSKEKPWDAYFVAIGFFLLAFLPVVFPPEGDWFLLICDGLLWGAGIWTLLMRKQRVWR